jgi:hypothetical protein
MKSICVPCVPGFQIIDVTRARTVDTQVRGTRGTHAEYIGFLTLLFRTRQQKYRQVTYPKWLGYEAIFSRIFSNVDHHRRGITRRNPSPRNYRSEAEAYSISRYQLWR